MKAAKPKTPLSCSASFMTAAAPTRFTCQPGTAICLIRRLPLPGGRTASPYSDGPLASVPAISDDVEQVLTKLLLLDGQILSYRALDVEQIGWCTRNLGFAVKVSQVQRDRLTAATPEDPITVVVDAEEMPHKLPASGRNGSMSRPREASRWPP